MIIKLVVLAGISLIVIRCIYGLIWCVVVNVLGCENFDPFARLKRTKRCRTCGGTFKTPVNVAWFGKLCPHCDTADNYEIVRGSERH